MDDPGAHYRSNGWWRDETFLDDLRTWVRKQPAKPAVIARRVADDTTRTLDYAELSAMTDRCAGALRELGVGPGDTVAVQLTNRWELAAIALACPRIGARLCPLMPMYRRREITMMVGRSEAKVFITMDRYNDYDVAASVLEAAVELPALEHLLVARTVGPVGEAAGPLPAVRDFDEFVFGTAWEERYQFDSAERGPDELGPDDPYLLLFTSGTTGAPKGVLHSQNTLYAAVRGEARAFGLDSSLVMSTTSPYTHYTGVVQGMLLPLILGGTMAFQDSWEGRHIVELLPRHDVTFLYIGPAMLRDMLDSQAGLPRPPALRWLVSGSAPIPPHFVDEVKKEFGLRLYSLWGMSENGPVTISRDTDPEDWAAHSDGSVIDGMELRIDPLPNEPDGVGLLWVRGPTQCLGYYGRDDLYNAQLDIDGWFDTGDLARPDGRGGIRITGRHRDMVFRHGAIVPVTEMESIATRHPRVREAALIGLPDGEGDEALCLTVTLVAGAAPVTVEELHAVYESAGVTDLYWPELLEIVDQLPLTSTGKVRKVELRELFAARTGELAPPIATGAAATPPIAAGAAATPPIAAGAAATTPSAVG